MANLNKTAVVLHIELDEGATTPSTPATSVSFSRQTTTNPSGSPNIASSPDARHFFQQLDNYIALGCLVSASNEHSQGTHDWEEVRNVANLVGLSPNILQDVSRLLVRGWIRIFSLNAERKKISRVYVLPGDVGHRYVDHSNRMLSKALHALVNELDVSPSIWHAQLSPENRKKFDPCAALDEGSLYYIFNTLPSPAPSTERVKSHFHREALCILLDPDLQLPGLRTQLYPYQRRSTGLMLQRESESRLELDPRLEQRLAPDGSMYFYGPRDTIFLRSPRFYESCKGGILAETMGLGKTLICIALILSTKGLLSKVPAQYYTVHKRPRVGSLVEMAVASINRHSAPWKSYFDDIAAATGEYMTHCIDTMRKNAPVYEVPTEPIRWNRKTTTPPPKRLMLASTTLIVVPRNLFLQWKTELEKHLEAGSLAILFMDDAKIALPSPQQLALYDVVLFSRTRFEQESRDGTDNKGRRQSRYPVSCTCPYIGATRKRDCTCLREGDLYDSPLKHIHFLRIIMDEGHFFSSSKTNAAEVANNIVRADHRWVVSGTPAKDLLGVEMDTIATDSATLPDESERQDALAKRRQFNVKEDTAGAIRSIGNLVADFLKVRPWTACEEERPAEWRHDIYRYENPRSKLVISGFSRCLRRTLGSIVVKTRPEDVERDIELPPLEHRIVTLEPSFYDKLTANTFVLVLTANAVTSERTDADYFWHPTSRDSKKSRSQLVANLRQSAFCWTGFSEGDIITAIKNSEGYLEKEGIACGEEDRALLIRCVEQAKAMLASAGWVALSKSHEVGFSVKHWPEDSAQFWSFDGSQPLLCGVTQLLAAQDHVNRRAASADPSEGLNGAGLRALSVLRDPPKTIDADGEQGPAVLRSGVPSSSVTEQKVFHKLPPPSSRIDTTRSRKPGFSVRHSLSKPQRSQGGEIIVSPSDVAHHRECHDLPPDSALRQTAISGTTSAKLSYLLFRIHSLCREEKIIVFYDGENTAYYLAQALELLHINHLIYAKSLTSAQKSDYIVKFDKEQSYRVLLMDVQQAAFGLNVTSASRVFFINFCRPHIEAQAIKRAHRIGQTRRVVVETLLLGGTIEEQLFERARRMTRAEHSGAKMLDDDGGIKDVIQHATLLPISESERAGTGQFALLKEPQQLWSREGWATWKIQEKAPETRTTNKRTIDQNPVKDGRPSKKIRRTARVDELETKSPTDARHESARSQEGGSVQPRIRLHFAAGTGSPRIRVAPSIPLSRVYAQTKSVHNSIFGGK